MGALDNLPMGPEPIISLEARARVAIHDASALPGKAPTRQELEALCTLEKRSQADRRQTYPSGHVI